MVQAACCKRWRTMRMALIFSPSGKLVISDGRSWSLYDASKGFQLLHKGSLPGNAIGKFPVTAHPSRDIFFILIADAAAKGVRLQAFDAQKGTLLAQGSFQGKSYLASFSAIRN